MKTLFPAPAGIKAWHRAILGPAPFPSDAPSSAAAFFRPAAALCRRPVAAEKALPASLPAALRKKLVYSLRLWQASQEITQAWAKRGFLSPGMDLPMTLNFAMALGNYSRFFIFSAKGLPAAAALRLHAAFAGEMTRMPAAMALDRLPARAASACSPAASTGRLAAAFAAALGGRP
ncbi:MAG: hypothetical protein A2X32_13190 [Elusimicrobia bacterium GWC2_64_44]|nr:MAG: hypothetical protein A2X32_13190 [Elusimicrobia bacterium GWC2_64_44]